MFAFYCNATKTAHLGTIPVKCPNFQIALFFSLGNFWFSLVTGCQVIFNQIPNDKIKCQREITHGQLTANVQLLKKTKGTSKEEILT